MRPNRFIRIWILCTFLMWTLAACALPDLRPFADATAQLHTAVIKTDTNVQLALSQAGVGDLAEELGEELAVRIAAMESVVNYTDALANISNAGQYGSDSAGSLANSLDGFLGALSAPTMPSNYVAIAESLYGIVANVRAASSLARATEKADPAIQSIATILFQDFNDLENVLKVSGKKLKSKLLLKKENNDIISYRKSLEKQRKQLETKLSENPTDTVKIKQLRQVNSLIDMTRDRYEPLMKQLKAMEDRTHLHVRIVQNSRKGLKQWAEIHGSLAENLKNGLPPNSRLIAATVIEIRELIKEEDLK